MSTEYYRLKKPFTSARCVSESGFTMIALRVNYSGAGVLTVRNDEVPDVLLALASGDYAVRVSVMKFGIDPGKKVLTFNDDDLEPDTTLISENGELTCLAEIDPDGKLTQAS